MTCSQESNGECSGNVIILDSNGNVIFYASDISITSSSSSGDSFLLPDGKVLVNANFSDTDANYFARSLVRLNSNGSVDYSFADNQTGINSTLADIRDIDLQSDGKIIVVGNFSLNYNGTAIENIIRLNADGSYDNTFFSNSNANNQYIVNAIEVSNDDKMMVGGSFYNYNDVPFASKLVRLNPDGTLDNNTFTSPFGNTNAGTVYDLVIQNDGKIIAVGNTKKTFDSQNVKKIMRFNFDGTLDTNYKHSNQIGGNISKVYNVTLLQNNKIIFGGNFDDFQYSDRKNMLVE